MTVEELVKTLSSYPPETEVRIQVFGDDSTDHCITNIECIDDLVFISNL